MHKKLIISIMSLALLLPFLSSCTIGMDMVDGRYVKSRVEITLDEYQQELLKRSQSDYVEENFIPEKPKGYSDDTLLRTTNDFTVRNSSFEFTVKKYGARLF